VHFKPFAQQSKNIIKAVLKVTSFKRYIVIQVSSEKRIYLCNVPVDGGVNVLDIKRRSAESVCE
jgi:hypothetical protein